MKKLAPYNGSCIDFFRNAVARKKNDDIRSRLKAIEQDIEAEFKNYEERFREKTIWSITKNEYLDRYKDDLHSLYGYQNFVIRKLRENISNLQILTIRHTCQNCTLVPVQSMDHILPKEQFPHFSINPLNLFPCCQTCNSYKAKAIGKDGKRLFLNLFLDDLPGEEYLFVNIFADRESYAFDFFLKKPDSVSVDLFEIISSHFELLRLRERMALAATTYISEFKHTIEIIGKRLPEGEVVNMIVEKVAEDRASYGDNYWKSALEIALINSPVFLSSLGRSGFIL